jgi:hypothetical protein
MFLVDKIDNFVKFKHVILTFTNYNDLSSLMGWDERNSGIQVKQFKLRSKTIFSLA